MSEQSGFDEASQQENADIRRMRALADENPKLKQENADLKRELAFTKAGIDTEDPKNKYFLKGYDGELEVGAVKAAAIESGYLPAPAPDAAVQQAQEGQQQVVAASTGTNAQFDPAAARHGMEQAMAAGGVDAMVDYGVQHGMKVARE